MKSLFMGLTLCIASLCSYAAEYRATFIGTESIPGAEWTIRGITDKGQVFGGYRGSRPGESSREFMFFHDPKSGLLFIEPGEHHFYSHTLVANNNGQIIGSWTGKNWLFIWSKALGVRHLDIFNNTGGRPIDFNDLGQMIGTYSDRPFLWDNGVATNMGPGSEFAKHIEDLGYQVMGITLMAINNKGEMAGWFQYGKYNEKQKKLIAAGYKHFFWDGSIHILPIPPAKYANVDQMRLNNKSVVMVTQYVDERINGYDKEVTFLWDLENGLQVVPDFRGADLNDSSTVLGFIKTYPSRAIEENGEKCALWKNGQLNVLADLLGVKNLEKMASPFSDSYAVEKIQDPVAINNKGQIVCLGYVWGEWHPCVLEPTIIQKQ